MIKYTFFLASLLISANNAYAMDQRAQEGLALGYDHLEMNLLSHQDSQHHQVSDVNAVDQYGFTKLHIAAHDGDTQAARELLAAGANVNAIASNGVTPFYYAALHERTEIMNLLNLHRDSEDRRLFEADTVNQAGFSQLHIASFNGHANVVRALLAVGANVNGIAMGATPFYYAAQKGHADVMIVLRSHQGFIVDTTDGQDMNTQLHTAAFNGDTNAIRALIDAGADTTLKNRDGYTVGDLAHLGKMIRISQFTDCVVQ